METMRVQTPSGGILTLVIRNKKKGIGIHRGLLYADHWSVIHIRTGLKISPEGGFRFLKDAQEFQDYALTLFNWQGDSVESLSKKERKALLIQLKEKWKEITDRRKR